MKFIIDLLYVFDHGLSSKLEDKSSKKINTLVSGHNLILIMTGVYGAFIYSCLCHFEPVYALIPTALYVLVLIIIKKCIIDKYIREK